MRPVVDLSYNNCNNQGNYKMSNKTKVAFIGSLNTDILADGISHFPGPGQHTYGEKISIAPGGKSRNAAQMAAEFLDTNEVAMAGITVKDQYGLYASPLELLEKSGVDTSYVKKVEPTADYSLPGIAIVATDSTGENRIIVFPGISETLSPQDIDNLGELFKEIADKEGYVCLGLEAPLETIIYAKHKAAQKGVRVILDPGGVKRGMDYSKLLDQDIYLIKPNEHEASTLTGITVEDHASAIAAAKVLREKGVDTSLITLGEKGAILFDKGSAIELHAPILDQAAGNSVGCGDQTLATLVAYLVLGNSLEEASQFAIAAGSLQFTKQGVIPISQTELTSFLAEIN